jgi:hypothetical protein
MTTDPLATLRAKTLEHLPAARVRTAEIARQEGWTCGPDKLESIAAKMANAMAQTAMQDEYRAKVAAAKSERKAA